MFKIGDKIKLKEGVKTIPESYRYLIGQELIISAIEKREEYNKYYINEKRHYLLANEMVLINTKRKCNKPNWF